VIVANSAELKMPNRTSFPSMFPVAATPSSCRRDCPPTPRPSM